MDWRQMMIDQAILERDHAREEVKAAMRLFETAARAIYEPTADVLVGLAWLFAGEDERLAEKLLGQFAEGKGELELKAQRARGMLALANAVGHLFERTPTARNYVAFGGPAERGVEPQIVDGSAFKGRVGRGRTVEIVFYRKHGKPATLLVDEARASERQAFEAIRALLTGQAQNAGEEARLLLAAYDTAEATRNRPLTDDEEFGSDVDEPEAGA